MNIEMLIRRLILLTLTSAAVACSTNAELPLEDTTPRASDPRDQVCDPSNQIVVFDSPQPCSDVAGGTWHGSRVFSGAGVPTGLQGYCAYEFQGQADSDDVKNLTDAIAASTQGEFEAGVDCQAVQPQGSAITDNAGPELEEYFTWLSGRITADEVATAVPLLSPAHVHTAIVDTYPSTQPINPNSNHGPFVASVVESFICPGGTGCSGRVQNYLGLPRTETGLDLAGGGQLGRQSDLARGIFNAMSGAAASGADHLVINLSVAWEAEEFGGMDLGDMNPASRAVYDVIRVARCRGALIIAAAGNESGLSCTGEPMAPARWEDIPAPTGPQCNSLGIASPDVDPAAVTPLLYAVGGLFSPGTPMSSTRAEGMPRLAAASSHVLAHSRAGLPNTTVQTGTSVAAAVASATASLVWSYRPTLSPSQIMQGLYMSGRPVNGHSADFGSHGAAPVRRIDACAALDFAIPVAALPCDPLPPLSLSDIVDAADDGVTAPTQTPTNDPAMTCTNVCGETYAFHPTSGSSLGCGSAEQDPWSGLTSPQPTQAGCPECVLTSDVPTDQANALLSVDNFYAGHEVTAVHLEVHDDLGNLHVFGVSEKELSSGVDQPERGSVTDYDVSVSLSGITPTRAYVVMDFEDPVSGRPIETRDAMVLRSE